MIGNSKRIFGLSIGVLGFFLTTEGEVLSLPFTQEQEFFVFFFLPQKPAWRAYLMPFSTTLSDSCLRHSKHKSWAGFLVVLGKRFLLLENHPTLSSSRECCMALPCLIGALSDERKREPVLVLTCKLDFVV